MMKTLLKYLLIAGGGLLGLAYASVTFATCTNNICDVCASGCNYTMIADAIAAADAGDTIHLSDETYTEQGITVDKDLTITSLYGVGGTNASNARSTIVQAHANREQASDRVFFISPETEVTIEGITIQHGVSGSMVAGGGGILVEGNLILEKSVVRNNDIIGTIGAQGSGIAIVALGQATIRETTIEGNSGSSVVEEGNKGSAVYISGQQLTMENSTVFGNYDGYGHSISMAIYQESSNSTVLKNVTVTNNNGGLAFYGGGFELHNVIAANNDGNDCERINGTQNANNNNLIEVNNGCDTPAYTSDTGIATSLADNGGPTDTIAILNTSEAVDAGDQTTCDDYANPYDQRRYTRTANATCDIGAYEYQGTAVYCTNGICDVCASGCNYTSIAAAIVDANAGDTIHLSDETYTEQGIKIDKDLTITSLEAVGGTNASDARSTIVQANATRGAATDRVFTINDGITATIEGMTIQHGNASDGGGLLVNGDLTLLTATVRENDGGGIYIDNGQATIRYTTIEGNSINAYGSGVMVTNTSMLTMENSTVFGNDVFISGGSVYISESGSNTGILKNVTIAGNVNSRGIVNAGDMALYNVIAVNNTESDCEILSGGSLSANVNNLIGSNDNCDSPTYTSNTGIATTLADNGGPTDTIVIDTTSDAFNTGDQNTCDNDTNPYDQRGYERSVDAACDIGAYEYQYNYGVCASGCQYTSIAAAIADAESGSVIHLSDEIYTESGIIIDKDLTITSLSALYETNASNARSTIVQATTDRVFTINSGVTATIEGLTIQNGSTDDNGGGILVNGNLTLLASTVRNNVAYDGGGIYIDGGQATIRYTTIEGNYAENMVAGVMLTNTATLIMENSTVFGNIPYIRSGSVYISNSGSVISSFN